MLRAAMHHKGEPDNIFRVKLYPSRNWQSRGYADLDTGTVEIAVAKGWTNEQWQITEIAQLLDHEIDHFLGLSHRAMAEPLWWLLLVPWSTDLMLRHRSGREPRPVEVKIRRLFDHLAMETDMTDIA